MLNISSLAQVVGVSPGDGKPFWGQDLWFRSVGASAQAGETDWLFMFILWTCIISFGLLLIPIIYFPFKYRRSNQKSNYIVSPAHHTLLELTWSIVPLIVMVFIFFWGFQGYMAKLVPAADAEEIMIRGAMWNWTATYRNGGQPDLTCRITETQTDSPVIYIPAGRPVKLILTSSDVLHSFFIPDFRTKIDVFPNRYTSMTFTAQKPNTPGPGGKWVNDDKASPDFNKPYSGHVVFCAEYCGTKHSDMAAWIVALPPAEYEKKIHELATKIPPGPRRGVGEIIAKRKGCFGCHSVDGSSNTGPTWKDLYGATHSYTNGESKLVDENSLRENIVYSQKRVMSGFTNQMPVYAGQIKPLELDALIAYIKTLSSKATKQELDDAELPLIPESKP